AGVGAAIATVTVAVTAACVAPVRSTSVSDGTPSPAGSITSPVESVTDVQVPRPRLPRLHTDVPAPILLTTSDRERFVALPGGRVLKRQRNVAGLPSPPPDALWVSAPTTWERVDEGHVVFGRGKGVVWRSRDPY